MWYEHAIAERIAPMYRTDLRGEEAWKNFVTAFGDRIILPEGSLPLSRERFVTAVPWRFDEPVLRGVYTG